MKKRSFGAALRCIRHSQGMIQAELAAKCRMSPMTIAHFERGRRMPSLNNFRKLARVLGKDAAWRLLDL